MAHRHPHRVAAATVAVLAGLSASAFGIASIAPDASRLPQRTLNEAVAIEGLEVQLEALAGHHLDLTRADITRASDTADSLLQRLGASDTEMAFKLRTDPIARRIVDGRPGKLIRARVDAAGTVIELVARFAIDGGASPMESFNRISITRDAGLGLNSKLEVAKLTPEVRMAGGTIQSSLFAATDSADIPDAVAVQMTEIFAGEIDFHHELRKGDTFSVVYEALTADGEPVAWNEGVGRVLAVEFINGGQAHHAVWFAGANRKGSYFDLQGKSKQAAFLASPLEFSRVSSGFAMRLHPILQTWRAHLGVDYAAPSGTPVRSVAEGAVTFAGWQNGYGNVVQVEHSKERSTLYAHLSHIDVRTGQKVAQSQHIGAVGATGWATGPHLHFEFRVNGVHQDPQRFARATETVALDAASRPPFERVAHSVQDKLDIAQSMIGAPVGTQ